MKSRFGKILRDNSLSIVIIAIFFLCLVGLSFFGWREASEESNARKQPTESYVEYVRSGDFVEAVFENWESEFLQMWALVVLTIWLRQKGASDSKPLRGHAPEDTRPRYAFHSARGWADRLRAVRHGLYSHSLSIALLVIFLTSFLLHAAGGTEVYNEDAAYYHTPPVSFAGYILTSRFWFESLQNWQSEFLAVGVLLLLSIKLRERGSPESKPVGVRYDHKTGSS
jgi:hypothetical protein